MRLRKNITTLPESATLAANEVAAARRADGKPLFHMGFGQAPFPAHPAVADALARAAHENRYERVAGLERLCDAARAYFATKLDLEPSDYEVVVAPGSKLLLFALQMAIEGDTLLPTPSWVSYEPQASMLGDRAIWVPTELSESGYRIDPERLRSAIVEARAQGLNPTKLILNSPNNPTGLELPAADHAELAELCAAEDIFVISDEIYGLVSFDGTHRSFARTLPEATAVTTGLSKHVSLGGWRVGFGLIPQRATGLYERLVAIASETWSAVSTPVQLAALVAVSGEAEIEEHIELCTRIHAAVARDIAARIDGNDVVCHRPAGAFYLWPDFEPSREALAARGIHTSAELAAALLTESSTLTLAGSSFGASPETLALRLSVCDYDGAQALLEFRATEDPAEAVETVAPRLVSGARAIRRFATDVPAS